MDSVLEAWEDLTLGPKTLTHDLSSVFSLYTPTHISRDCVCTTHEDTLAKTGKLHPHSLHTDVHLSGNSDLGDSPCTFYKWTEFIWESGLRVSGAESVGVGGLWHRLWWVLYAVEWG